MVGMVGTVRMVVKEVTLKPGTVEMVVMEGIFLQQLLICLMEILPFFVKVKEVLRNFKFSINF